MSGNSNNQIMTACVNCMVVMMVCAVAAGSNNFPNITKRDFNGHIQQLSLDSDLKSKAKAIFESYQTDLQATLEYRDQMLRWIWSNLPESSGGYAPNLRAEVTKDERSVEATVQIGLRQLERIYFKQLAELDNSLIEPVESLRRLQLRNRLLTKSTFADTAPYGIDCDVTKLVEEIVPNLKNNPESVEQLVSYEEQMDWFLMKLDDMLMKHNLEGNKGIRDFKAKFERGEIQPDEINEQVSHVADGFVQINYLLTQIRALNSRTIQAVAPLLSEQDAQHMKDRGRQYLARYMFESSNALPNVLITRALKLQNLTTAQQEILANFQMSYANKESATEKGLERVYQQMITKRMYRLSYEVWVREIILKETIEDPLKQLREQFNVKVEKWNKLQAQFSAQLKAILTDSQWQQIQ